MDDDIIRRGQTVLFRLDYTVNDEPLIDFSADDLEWTFGGVSYFLSNGDIYFDPDEQAYCVFLSQERTFALSDTATYQLRILKDGEVTPSRIEFMYIGESLSENVLSVGDNVEVS